MLTEAPALLPGTRGVATGQAFPAAGRCPACDATTYTEFYRQDKVPIDSFRLVDSRAAGINFPTGRLDLAICEACGFIWNRSFDPALQDYSAVFEETQWFSRRFQKFGQSLAQRLIDRHDIRGKRVLEIGCGPGHFLSLICEMGGNRGVGLDPHFVEKAGLSAVDSPSVRILNEYFSAAHAHLAGELVVCRHTLEHIQPVGELLRLVRATLQGRSDTVVFCEVPDVLRTLRQASFWQFYYEHCSYFSAGSLARLYRATGFEVGELYLDFDDQYVLIEGRPLEGTSPPGHFRKEETVDQMIKAVAQFSAALPQRLAYWRGIFDQAQSQGKTVVFWGGAPQAVAFGLALGIEEQVAHIVNINPVQHGRFAVGTGQEIVAPGYLKTLQPDTVVLMNAIYRDEVRQSLADMHLHAELLAV